MSLFGTPVRPGGIRETLKVAGPLALALAASAVNGIVDTVFLGHSSDAALAALLPAFMLSTLVVAFFSGTVGYTTVFVAQLHGGGRGREAVHYFAQGLWLALASVPALLAMIPVAFAVVDVTGCDAAIRAAEKSYLLVQAPAGVFTIANAVLGGIITGQGRTVRVSLCTVAGCLVNMAIDPVLIFGYFGLPALGITGASIATATGFATTTALLAIVVLRDPLVRESVGTGAFRPDLRAMARIVRTGVPNGLTAFFSTLAYTGFTMMLTRLDPLSCAASNVVFRVNNLFYLLLCATSDGTQILIGRHHGAGDDGVAERSYRTGLGVVVAALVLCFGLVFAFLNPVMDCFRGADSAFDPAVWRRTGLVLFAIMFVREIAEGVMCLTVGALRAVGDTRFVMLVQSGVELVLWMPAYLAVGYGIDAAAHPAAALLGLWFTLPFSMGLIALVLYWRWRRGAWRGTRLA